MGIFRKNKSHRDTEIAIRLTPDQIRQNRLNMQGEIDKLDYELAKRKKTNELARLGNENSPGKKFKRTLMDIGEGLDAFAGIGEPPKGRKKSALDDPWGDSF